MKVSIFNELPTTDNESLTLNLHKKLASGTMNVLGFIDKDTKQHVLYIPALDISGYGATRKKASEMLQFALTDFMNYLASMTPDNIQIELSKFGWKRTVLQKEFARSYMDVNRHLQNLNAEDNKIERLTLQAA